MNKNDYVQTQILLSLQGFGNLTHVGFTHDEPCKLCFGHGLFVCAATLHPFPQTVFCQRHSAGTVCDAPLAQRKKQPLSPLLSMPMCKNSSHIALAANISRSPVLFPNSGSRWWHSSDSQCDSLHQNTQVLLLPSMHGDGTPTW